MSADGYFRLPRRLMRSKLSPERRHALAWLVSEASYTEREVNGVTLRVGETPPFSLTTFEIHFRWSRKAVRLFVDYMLSPECAGETGIRVRIGQKVSGHTEGHSKGHSQGHTYLIGLVKFSEEWGHTEGHSQGHSIQKTEEKKVSNTPPTGESRGGLSENGTAPRKRAVPKPLPDDWRPSEKHRLACEASAIDCDALFEDFVFYWHSINGTKSDWNLAFSKRIAAVRSTGKFRMNGKHTATGITSVPDDAVAAAIVARMKG